jgi:hypothetical protein
MFANVSTVFETAAKSPGGDDCCCNIAITIIVGFMLSEETSAALSTLTYRPDAKRQVCILPLGSIYWEDELPQVQKFAAFPEPDRNAVLRAFTIRMRLWDCQSLSDDDRQFWDSVRSAVPNWAIFHRLDLSDDDRREREETELVCAKEFEEFIAGADEVTVGEERHGMQSFSATFRLDKDQSAKLNEPSWWGRWSSKLKRFINR